MQDPEHQSIVHKAAYLFPDFDGELVSRCYWEARSCNKQWRAAVAKQDKKAAKVAWKRIRRSLEVKIVAMITTLRAGHGLTFEQMCITAGEINFAYDCGEHVLIWAEEKTGGSIPQAWLKAGNFPTKPYRIIAAYGPIRRARNEIVCQMLRAIHSLHPSNYLTKGKGPEALSDRIIELTKEGYKAFVLFDVKDFYPSVRQGKEELGLPAEVVRHDVFTAPEAKLIILGKTPNGVSQEQFVEAARQGLPQGKATSSIVAGILYGRVLEHIAPAHRVFFYGDDGGIACDKAEAETIANSLRGAFISHPAGPFQLKLKKCDIYSGFEFVKYFYKWIHMRGYVRRTPGLKNYRRFEARVAEIVVSNPHGEAMPLIDKYKACWIASFPHWHANDQSKFLLDLNVLEGISQGQNRLGESSTLN